MQEKILVLNNNIQLLVLDEVSIDGLKYYYVVVLENDRKPTDKFYFVEEYLCDNKTVVQKLKDKETIKKVSMAFALNFLDFVDQSLEEE